jgi:hypothetical protein
MSSNINPAPINQNYPIAGQDNPSQGFRDNFATIKSALAVAQAEMTDLQAKAVLKTALIGDVLDNDLGDNLVTAARIRDFSEAVYAATTGSGTITLDHENGHYQTITTTGSVTLAFSNWPASGSLGRIRLAISVANTAHTLTLPSAVTVGYTDIAGINASTRVITFAATGTYVFEFTTVDAGVNIAVSDLSRARNRIQDTELQLQQRTIASSVGSAGDTNGMIAVDDDYLYVCTGVYDGSTGIWKRVTLGAVF